MEIKNTEPNSKVSQGGLFNPLTKVTKLSKYLTIFVFIFLPFFSGFVGYQYGKVKNTAVVESVSFIQSISTSSDNAIEVQPEVSTTEIALQGDIEKIGLYSIVRGEQKVYYPTHDNESDSPTTTPIKLIEIPGVDSQTFKVLENESFKFYAQDKNNVYFLESNFWSGEVTFKILEGADPETFEAYIVTQFPISQGNTYQNFYAWDNDFVYYRGNKIKGADPKTFVLSDEIPLSTDVDTVFLYAMPLPGADPITYQFIASTGTHAPGAVYGKDNSVFYINYCTFDTVDVDSLEVVNAYKHHFRDISGEFIINFTTHPSTTSCAEISISR